MITDNLHELEYLLTFDDMRVYRDKFLMYLILTFITVIGMYMIYDVLG